MQVAVVEVPTMAVAVVVLLAPVVLVVEVPA
jgi:hypothetical protein